MQFLSCVQSQGLPFLLHPAVRIPRQGRTPSEAQSTLLPVNRAILEFNVRGTPLSAAFSTSTLMRISIPAPTIDAHVCVTIGLHRHLPANLVASFVKRLSRLSLSAPPAAVVMLIPFTYNMLRRHPALMAMIHRTEDGAGDECGAYRILTHTVRPRHGAFIVRGARRVVCFDLPVCVCLPSAVVARADTDG